MLDRVFWTHELLKPSEIVVGVISSGILTNEPFGWREIVGSSLIVLGVILAVVLAPKEDNLLN